MELQKNVYCNTDNPVCGSTIKLYYTGSLYESGSSEVYIRYGFGYSWDNTTETKMILTDLGFEASISLETSGILNFCFRNEKHQWDNNNEENYCFVISSCSSDVPECLSTFEEWNPENTEVSLQVIQGTTTISKKLKEFIKRIVNYVPKILSGTWKRKKTSNN